MKLETGCLKVIGLLLMSLLTGCATGDAFKLYSGSAKGEKEVTRLIIPPELEIGFCDGVKIYDPDLKSAGLEREAHLLPGMHFMELRYDTVFMDAQNRATKVQSSSRFVQFSGKPGFCYRVLVPRLKTVAEAKKYADDPTMNVQADMYSGRVFSSPRPLSVVPPTVPVSNLPVAPSAVAAQPAPAVQPVKAPTPAPAKTAPPVTKAVAPAKTPAVAKQPAPTKAATLKNTEALQNLKAWYNKASPEEKVEFDNWRNAVGK